MSDAGKGLHISREITWGHIMTTVALVVAGISAFFHMESNITLMMAEIDNHKESNRAEIVRQQVINDKQDKRNDEVKKEINKKLDKMGGSIEQIKDHLIRGHDIRNGK